ncbi:MAG: hypothetical protein JXB25_06495 [Deltaproteobacteria bacterium]|nr:hypothetical protein [Deltaproteobacteria bacterium]
MTPPSCLDAGTHTLNSLLDINRLGAAEKEACYAALLPEGIFSEFGIDPETLCGTEDGLRKVEIIAPEGLGLVRIEVRLAPADRDCLFFTELADTQYLQLELSFFLTNDPAAPRFDIDRDASGRDNHFGSCRRNIAEEIRAFNAGLAPHQVRRGKGLFRPFLPKLEVFSKALGAEMIVTEALCYANAIQYERHGFDYVTGKALMRWIDREFQPGGLLFRRLDGSSPFRAPGMEKTVRGRSWAIHDGIMDQPWDEVRMYKRPGVEAGIDTFPARIY